MHATCRKSPACSGGKDSCYNMVMCEQYGHQVRAQESAPDVVMMFCI
jgi:diphthamide synthase (EF-2-diphthine--ammonia ligase)